MRAAIAAGLTLLLGPTAAGAEDRYAEPGGTGTCTQAAPCDIDEAVEGSGADAGDVVKLLPGTHTPTETASSPGNALVITQPLTIEPADPATRPTISASGLTTVISFAAGATIRGLNITAVNPTASALNLQQAALAERLHVGVSGTTGQTAASVRNGATLRDSVAWTAPASGVAVATGGSGATLDNVTASGGFRGIAIDSNFGPTQSVEVTNTVAMGGSPGDDIFVREAAGTSVTVSITNSNYDDLANSGADVTETGTQVAAPSFLLPSLGNFHQLEGSPTINAGIVQASTASRRDIDGDLRWLGAAPDIGADEWPEAAPPGTDPPGTDPPGTDPPATDPPAGEALPQTTITKPPKRKLRTKKRRAKVKISFVSSPPGSSFECSLDGKPFRPCASPFKAKLKPGRHRFQVRAVGPTGARDETPALARWKIKRRR